MKQHAVIRRDATIRSLFAGALVLWAVASLLFSHRPLILGDRSVVVAGPVYAPANDAGRFAQILDDYAAHILKTDHIPLALIAWHLIETPAALPPKAQQVRIGYSGTETCLLGMPLWVRRDLGPVLYYDDPGGMRMAPAPGAESYPMPAEYVAAPIADIQFDTVGLPAPDIGAIWFPYWRHMWGWLFLLLLAGYGVFEWQAIGRRRDALGLI